MLVLIIMAGIVFVSTYFVRAKVEVTRVKTVPTEVSISKVTVMDEQCKRDRPTSLRQETAEYYTQSSVDVHESILQHRPRG